QRGFELHAAILGIVKAGAAYVPIDRETPAGRVETILDEVGAAGYFSTEQLNTHCQLLDLPHPDRSGPQPEVPQPKAPQPEVPQPEAPHPDGPHPDDRAYVLYTSGSTGKPKGIPISHRQICHLVRSEQVLLDVRSEDRVYQGFSVS